MAEINITFRKKIDGHRGPVTLGRTIIAALINKFHYVEPNPRFFLK